MKCLGNKSNIKKSLPANYSNKINEGQAQLQQQINDMVLTGEWTSLPFIKVKEINNLTEKKKNLEVKGEKFRGEIRCEKTCHVPGHLP